MARFLLIIAIFFVANLFGEVPENYPVPKKTGRMLFYIQRNHNSNTIVYDAKFDNKGNLVKDNPIDVYWLRYQEQGQRMELRKVEKMFAYGVECSQVGNQKNQFEVELVAHRERSFTLIQQSPFKATLYTIINKRKSQIEHMYIYADNSGYWPKVKYIELFGNDIETGERTYERVWNE